MNEEYSMNTSSTTHVFFPEFSQKNLPTFRVSFLVQPSKLTPTLSTVGREYEGQYYKISMNSNGPYKKEIKGPFDYRLHITFKVLAPFALSRSDL